MKSRCNRNLDHWFGFPFWLDWCAVLFGRWRRVLKPWVFSDTMAEAFRDGNLGIMDYYRMKNLAADTDMRSKIAGGDESPKEDK